MRIGPITVSWTKAVAEQAVQQQHDNELRLSVIEQLTARNIEAEALLRRWGLENGIIGPREWYQRSMPPRAVGAVHV